jgi:hypothetical protein
MSLGVLVLFAGFCFVSVPNFVGVARALLDRQQLDFLTVWVVQIRPETSGHNDIAKGMQLLMPFRGCRIAGPSVRFCVDVHWLLGL